MLRLTRFFVVLPLAAAAIGFTPARASDPIGIYGIIDRVVLAPDSANPTTIQLFGVFSITEGIPGDHYKPAARGYLYFSAPAGTERVVRAEWNDLKSVAGKGQVVGFGAHYARPGPPRLRCATETPARPDPYQTNIGVVRGVPNPPNTSASTIRADLAKTEVPAARCSG